MSRSHKVFPPVRLHPNAFLARAALLVLLYLSTGHLGLAVTYLSPNISLLWLPAGVAVAGLMRYGNRMLGMIYLAAFLQDLSAGLSPATAALVSFGNTLAAFVCCMVLRHKEVHPQFLQRKDVIWFTIAAMVGMTMSASIGTLVLGWHGWVENLPLTWSTWWAGDLVGTLLMAPLLLSLSASSVKDLIKRREEIIIFLLIFSTINWFIFMVTERQIDLTFIVVATTIWSALRFGVTGATAIALASSAIAAFATANGRGPFTDPQTQSNLLILWAYMITVTMVTLLITALQAESVQAAREVQDALQRINKVASRLPGLIMQYRIRADRSVSIPYASDAILGIFEVTQEQVVSDAMVLFQRIDSRDVENGTISLREATRTMSPWQNEFRFRRTDSKVRWLLIDGLPEREADGAMLWHCFVSDITERKQTEKDVRIAAFTFESQEGIFVTDADWQILRVNHAFSKITGYDSDELIGQRIQRHYDKQQDKAFYDVLMEHLKEHQFWQGELWNRRKNGEFYPQMITVTAITDSRNEITNYVGSFTDISRHKGYEAEIRNLAFYDPLTQLPNRRLLMDRLQHLISISKRNESHSAILFIDLDNFKTLNDTRGHDAGDILLVETARRLQTCMRKCDTVARLGGDEFVVVLEELSHTRDEAIQQTDRIAEKIRQVLSQPYAIMDFEHHGSSSIGACLFQGNDVTVKDLFKRADTAMYEAKTSGRNAVRFFDPAMQAILVVRMMLESNLRLALAQNQFQLYYQVQVNSDGKLIGAEALLRWIHPDRGFISPADFIPLAEETGLIIPIGLWVMETACAQIKLWEAHEDSRHLSLAVNVSAKQFKQADFVEAFTEIVHRHGIDPTRLKIELTESTVLDNVDATTEKMHQLKKLGISFSMDDFGTGYSSLAYLQRLPLNQLKIDQSFVRDLSDDENDATIVRAIISLGVNLGLNVIAEGVETDAQRSFLIQHNCLAFQGYLFSKPLPLDGFLKLLALDSSKNPT
ncbi:EAL domain-containing protein [Undibacterium sp. RTI2.1]|uniref:bifunctional diguanylate cyclase/phosphodiesterase n=1 Tax=unclassified Undibacterium TaxID=2630295 RepID=UPI002B235533|nr:MULTISPECIES: EAL domain-containing protein [unclassified Undibacterium]MEB0029405.1 EAL domain-containing protein [Undibacterium sp. RTI2.1]MEB0115976.1 EAL domain-containing protein [Undibacterium sp. RTI2.2]